MKTSLFVYLISFLPFIACSTASTGNDSSPNQIIEGEYLVILHSNYTLDEHLAYLGLNATNTTIVLNRFDGINAYHGRMSTQQYEVVASDPGVELVEHNRQIQLDPPAQRSTSRRRHRRAPNWNLVRQDFPQWHLGVSSTWGTWSDDNEDPYQHWKTADGQLPGYGVQVYVLDTGANPVAQLPNLRNFYKSYIGQSFRDVLGHGTSVMGLIGGMATDGEALGLAPGGLRPFTPSTNVEGKL